MTADPNGPAVGDRIYAETQARDEFVYGTVTEVRPDGSVLAEITDGPWDLLGEAEFLSGEFHPATPPAPTPSEKP